ncbi:hypothetical protein [Liquorilactobacillus sucicola]|uniref:hypothetical protein n=1 Tax=Liquorilactobacillus sucicola TaxID=519050 RepID=UPI00054E31FB|nr:hypothetical protein [Liquorilactobacillus sucicola]
MEKYDIIGVGVSMKKSSYTTYHQSGSILTVLYCYFQFQSARDSVIFTLISRVHYVLASTDPTFFTIVIAS